MAKSIRLMEKDIRLVDAVIYLLDARAVKSSINPYFDKIIKDKKRLYLINKSDLADGAVNALWLKYFSSRGEAALLCDGRNFKCAAEIIKALNELLKEKILARRERGLNLPLRAMVIGIPNSGKSTVINTLCRRKKTQTGNIAGVTRGKQWVKLDGGIDLLDTPGTLWNAFDDEKTGYNLAAIGSIKDDVTDNERVAAYLLSCLAETYPDLLRQRYGIEIGGGEDMLNEIGKKTGALKEGRPDTLRAAKSVLDDFRKARTGNISLEKP
jgi:ribosome biogenesis GTPase A